MKLNNTKLLLISAFCSLALFSNGAMADPSGINDAGSAVVEPSSGINENYCDRYPESKPANYIEDFLSQVCAKSPLLMNTIIALGAKCGWHPSDDDASVQKIRHIGQQWETLAKAMLAKARAQEDGSGEAVRLPDPTSEECASIMAVPQNNSCLTWPLRIE